MARRTAQSFAKRQKEMARKERAQQKAQKRAERKLQKTQGSPGAGDEFELLTGPPDFLAEDAPEETPETSEATSDDTVEART